MKPIFLPCQLKWLQPLICQLTVREENKNKMLLGSNTTVATTMLCFLGFYGDMFSLYLDKIHSAGTKHTSCGNTILKGLWRKKSVAICIHEKQQHKHID